MTLACRPPKPCTADHCPCLDITLISQKLSQTNSTNASNCFPKVFLSDLAGYIVTTALLLAQDATRRPHAHDEARR